VELSSDQRQAQITHRLHSHDAITWLRNEGQLQPNLDDLKQRALIALHAANNTHLWQQDEIPITVRVIGAETEDTTCSFTSNLSRTETDYASANIHLYDAQPFPTQSS